MITNPNGIKFRLAATAEATTINGFRYVATERKNSFESLWAHLFKDEMIFLFHIYQFIFQELAPSVCGGC